jgi:hypothetical protein
MMEETTMKNPTRFLATVAAGALMTGAAWAGNMDARIGNTVLAKAPDGTTTKFWYAKPDTFTVKIEEPGKPAVDAKGKWRVDKDKLCLTADTSFGPFEKDKESCVPLMGDKVGDTWKSKSKDAAGAVVDVDVSIVAGH